MNRDDLYRYQVENKAQDVFIKLLLRSYAGIFSGFSQINEAELARRGNLDEAKVVSNLETLQRHGLISYVKQSDKPTVMFPFERMDQKNLPHLTTCIPGP